MRYILVLASGGAIGAVVCLTLGMTLPAALLGAFVGAVAAYVGWDVQEIRHRAPEIFRRSFATSRGLGKQAMGLAGTAVRVLVAPRLLVWIWCVPTFFLTTAVVHTGNLGTESVSWEGPPAEFVLWWLGFSTAMALFHVFALVICAAIESTALQYGLVQRDNTKLPWSERDPEWSLLGAPFASVQEYRAGLWRQLKMYSYIWLECIKLLFLLPLILWEYTKATWRWLRPSLTVVQKLAVALLRDAATFAWRLFIAIHSQKRRMAFVDSALGMLTGYAVMRLAYGDAFFSLPPASRLAFIGLCAACAVGLGLVNCHLIAKRALKITLA